MRRDGKTVLAALAVFSLLGACVPDATMTGSSSNMTPAQRAEAEARAAATRQGGLIGAEKAYLAAQDGPFTVPAVPLDKLPEGLRRQTVTYETPEAPGTIIINPSQRVLYFVTGKNKAIRYGIAVGKEGFEWSGEAVVSDRRHWPTWTPPKEMIARKPELSKWEKGQPGGPENPLGARALYLTTNGRDYGYRIHGTPEWWSIGRNASSGCIRMINQDVMDLYNRVPDGAKVIVLTRDGKLPTRLSIPAPAPVKKAVAKKAAPAPAPAPIVVPPPAVMPAPVITGPATPTPAAAPAPAVPATDDDA